MQFRQEKELKAYTDYCFTYQYYRFEFLSPTSADLEQRMIQITVLLTIITD